MNGLENGYDNLFISCDDWHPVASSVYDRGKEKKVKKLYTFEWLLFLVFLGIFSTIVTFLASQSIVAALCLTWSPVIIGGTYLLGKRAGRG